MAEINKKWWLISDEDVQVIKGALMSPKQVIREGLMTRTLRERARARQKALHTLESGLHVTDAVPEDWRKEG